MAKRAFASIAEFFSTRREALSNRVSGSSLRIFLGNEACDADSIISSVCMSYLQYNQLDAQTVVLPVLPLTNREELYLRPEAMCLMESVGFQAGDILLFHEVPELQHETCNEESFSLVLMDHNSLSQETCHLASRVDEIFDHHLDQGNCDQVVGSKRVIEFGEDKGFASGSGLGSTCTIVAEQFLSQAPELLSAYIAKLLLGVILLDTVNMSEHAKKTTERDARAIESLRRIAFSDASDAVQLSDALFQQLSQKKFDLFHWQALSTSLLLIADFKKIAFDKWALGTSSICLPFESLISSRHAEEFYAALSQFCSEKELNIFMLLVCYQKDDVFCRELILFRPSSRVDDILENLSQYLDSVGLMLTEMPISANWVDEEYELLPFFQGDSSKSRKQLVPLVIDFLSGSSQN